MKKKNLEWQARIVEKKKLSPGHVFLTLDALQIASSANPGQFVNIASGHLLKRPFGIASADKEKGTISVGIHVVGRGSKAISEKNVGDVLHLLGPLGNHFQFDQVRCALLIGGGTGVYPLLFAAKWLVELGIDVTTVLGFRDPGSILLADAFRSLSSRLIVASETGGADIKGTAISALEMPGLLPDKAGLTIFSCGPVGLLSAVASFAGQMNIPAQVSLETRMGCGVGICRCCPVPVGKKTEDGAVEIADYERCCVEGPVFDAAEIVFEELLNG